MLSYFQNNTNIVLNVPDMDDISLWYIVLWSQMIVRKRNHIIMSAYRYMLAISPNIQPQYISRYSSFFQLNLKLEIDLVFILNIVPMYKEKLKKFFYLSLYQLDI